MPFFKDLFSKCPRDTLILLNDEIYARIKHITDPHMAKKDLVKHPITLQTVLK
jgi:hypothetical protein